MADKETQRITIEGLTSGPIGTGFLCGKSTEHIVEAITAAIPSSLEGHFDSEYAIPGSPAQQLAGVARRYGKALQSLQTPDQDRSDIVTLRESVVAQLPYE